jgi:hypothetical protein
MNNSVDPQAVKAASEAEVLRLGGKVCDWLPTVEIESLRSMSEVADRTLAMHGMVQLAFNAPKEVIRAWLAQNGLLPALSHRERDILGNEGELAEQERTHLYWYIEALWALGWAGSLIPNLSPIESVGSNLAALLPDIRVNESGSSFRTVFRLRPVESLFPMLDLYYRSHWYARNGQLNGYATEPFSLDVIMERRKALEWVSDSTIEDWDDTPADT